MVSVLLVNLGRPNREPTDPLGIEVLAGHLRSEVRGCTISVVDMPTFSSEERALRAIEQVADPDIVGLSMMWANFDYVESIARELRRRFSNATLVLGGSVVYALGDEVLHGIPSVDVAVRGEGEHALSGLVRGKDHSEIPNLFYRSDGGREVSFTFSEQCDPYEAAVPDRNILDEQQRHDFPYYAVNVEISRGCEFGACTFCHLTAEQREHRSTSEVRFRKYRRAPEENAWRDYESVVLRHPRKINFVDEEFFGGRGDPMASAGAAFLRRVTESGLGVPIPKNLYARAPDIRDESVALLKSAGVTSVFLGIESGSEADLHIFAKGASIAVNESAIESLRRERLRIKAGFIMLHPLSSGTSLKANIEFLLRNELLPCVKNPLNSLDIVPNTTMHIRLRDAHPEVLGQQSRHSGTIAWQPADDVLRFHWATVRLVTEQLARWTDEFRFRHTTADHGGMPPGPRAKLSAMNARSLEWLWLLADAAERGAMDEQTIRAEARRLVDEMSTAV